MPLNYNKALQYAALNGHVEIVKLCKKWGVTDYKKAMYYAALNGHVEIVKLCKEYGAREYGWVMEIADFHIGLDEAKNGYIKIVKLCREWLGFEAIHNELYQYHHKKSILRAYMMRY